MDQGLTAIDARDLSGLARGLVVTGAGHVLAPPAADPTPWLKVRKARKFMAPQDDLAVVAAGRALESAGLAPAGGAALGERAGLYLAVGFLPFEREDIDRLLAGSLDETGRFSMARFATDGFAAVNPLVTFKCLSNMPAYHISASFDLQGPYFVTYPGPGQFYVALEEGLAALAMRAIDVALVGGVAHQRNFLVEHARARAARPVAAESLADAAGCLVIERAERAAARGARTLARLVAGEVAYEPTHPFEETSARGGHKMGLGLDMGAAAMAVGLSRAIAEGVGHGNEQGGRGSADGGRGAVEGGRGPADGLFRHAVATDDGYRASSTWEIAP